MHICKNEKNLENTRFSRFLLVVISGIEPANGPTPMALLTGIEIQEVSGSIKQQKRKPRTFVLGWWR